MAKSPDTEQMEELRVSLSQIYQKLNSSRVLNGGFDKLEEQVSEIKELQTKLNADFENHKINDDRIESKIDRLYDPEEGIYTKVAKIEIKIDQLQRTDNKTDERLQSTETSAKTTADKVAAIETIAGKDNADLIKAVKFGKGFWWMVATIAGGILAAVGKFLVDMLTG